MGVCGQDSFSEESVDDDIDDDRVGMAYPVEAGDGSAYKVNVLGVYTWEAVDGKVGVGRE